MHIFYWNKRFVGVRPSSSGRSALDMGNETGHIFQLFLLLDGMKGIWEMKPQCIANIFITREEVFFEKISCANWNRDQYIFIIHLQIKMCMRVDKSKHMSLFFRMSMVSIEQA